MTIAVVGSRHHVKRGDNLSCAIKLENLTKKYKNNRGIDSISLEVNQGEIFGFLGPNGAGKTTAMKIMTGLMKADNGDVFLNGKSILHSYEQAMSGVGCIVESVAMFPYLTAFENMKLCARFYKNIDKDAIDNALEATGMLKFKNEKVKNFSLGMRQRMGISMALVSSPDILILDEPLNGLDVEGMVDMRNLFKKLSRDNGTTVFISSHLIHDVELTCDKVGVVNSGKLLCVESIDNILKSYSSLENFYLSEVGENGNV